MPDFQRPTKEFPFIFAGMKVSEQANSIPPNKYALAMNIRAYKSDSIRTRPGYATLFTGGAAAYTDMRAYTALATDDLPRVLARDATDKVFLDTGTQVGTLAGAGATPAATMIPFRPNASPQPWMYIANGADYQKFSAPSPTNMVTAQKVGIAEPQSPPDAALGGTVFDGTYGETQWYTHHASPALTAGGTASATTGTNRVSDTVFGKFVDPAAVGGLVRMSILVPAGTGIIYQKGMVLEIGGIFGWVVLDVFPGMSATLGIQSIYYFSGTTGRCIIVPSGLSAGVGNEGQSLYAESYLTTLRRGAIISIGGENCYVWSVTEGPDGTVAIETSTTSTHTASQKITLLPAFSIFGRNTGPGHVITAGDTILCAQDGFSVSAGIGTQTSAPGLPNPFIPWGTVPTSFQPDDYVHISVKVDNLSNLNEIRLQFDVGDGSYTQNYYYYAIRPSDLALATAATNPITQIAAAQTVAQRSSIDTQVSEAAFNAGIVFSGQQTPPGSNQWAEISFPISALTRVGDDQTKTLINATNFQIQVNANATVNVAISSGVTFGGGQPDVGEIGAPYLYRVRPRSSVTGAVGNPSPATRYGMSPLRQVIRVILPSATYDPQIDTWDVFRYGGTVTSWRYIGSTPSSNPEFQDNYDDSAAQNGNELDFDNFEPWPSVDLPNTGATTQVTGTIAVVTSTDPDITSYLPGTLVQLGGANVYTLWNRPISLGGTSYLLQFVENAGFATNIAYTIQEPAIARQFLPFMWGPDASGTVFACGDGLRPGSVYFSKNNAPDSAPDSYNIEIVPPSEPLQGGIVMDGLSFVASTERWWALYPQPDNPAQRYNVVQQPFTRGLAAPAGACTDGVSVFWWAKDGIYSSSEGSLTDADLYDIFPHDGIPGHDYTYNVNFATVSAPDYSRVGKFRLAYVNGYLYATYQNSGGTYCQLVYDIHRKGWILDRYAASISTLYHVEQTPESSGVLNPVLLLGGVGKAYQQTDLHNDDLTLVQGQLCTFEFDGGDARAPKLWGDIFVDCAPSAQGILPLSLSLMSANNILTGFDAYTIPTSPSRVRTPVDLGQAIVSDFLGIAFLWQDDFTKQPAPTRLYLWQPSFTIQPARTLAFYTFGSSFGMDGYYHLRELLIAWVSTAPVTLTITSYDGQSPQAIVIPSSGGTYKKQVFPVTANKGLLYKFQAVSTQPFQFFMDDFEIHAGAWARQGAYATRRDFGGQVASQATI